LLGEGGQEKSVADCTREKELGSGGKNEQKKREKFEVYMSKWGERDKGTTKTVSEPKGAPGGVGVKDQRQNKMGSAQLKLRKGSSSGDIPNPWKIGPRKVGCMELKRGDLARKKKKPSKEPDFLGKKGWKNQSGKERLLTNEKKRNMGGGLSDGGKIGGEGGTRERVSGKIH